MNAGKLVLMLMVGAFALPSSAGFQEEVDRVSSLLKGRRYAEAETASRQLLGRVESSHGVDSLEAAGVADLLVTALLKGGKAHQSEALELAERSLRIKQAILQPHDTRLVASLRNMGHMQRERSRYEEARAHFERALRIDEKAHGRGHVEVAWDVRYLGNVELDLGRFDEAKRLYEDALRIASGTLPPDDSDLADVEYNLAITLRRLGEYDQARPRYEHVIAIKERALAGDDPALSFYLNGYAVFLDQTGDYAGARRLYERVLEIRRKSLGDDHLDVATALNNLSLVLSALGDDEGSRNECAEALRIREKALPPDHILVAQSLHNLGVQEAQLGDLTAARSRFERALQIKRQAHGSRYPGVATTLQRLAQVLIQTAERAHAEEMFQEALAIWSESLRQAHQDTAFCLEGLGSLRLQAGDLSGAEAMYGRAIHLLEQALGPGHPRVAEAAYSLSRVAAKSGQTGKAMDHALRSERIARDHLSLTARFLPERLALRYAAARARSLDLAVSLAMDKADPALTGRVWDAIMRSRAQILDEMASRHRSVSVSGDPEIRRLSEAIASSSKRLAHLSLAPPGPEQGKSHGILLEEARRQKEKAESALAERSAPFRREYEAGRAGLAEVRRGLPADGALVAFATTRSEGEREARYTAFVLAPGADPVAVTLGPSARIDDLILRWKREAAHSGLEADYRSAGVALRERIWDPVARELRGAARVFLVPDGALHLVGFASLPTGDQGYLIDSGPLIEYLSAERGLLAEGHREKNGTGLLALGDPAFDEPGSAGQKIATSGYRSACGVLGALPSHRLPHAAKEVEDISAQWRGGSSTVLTGARATEEAFKKMAPGRRVLHLATHGFFVGESCAGSETRGFGALSPAIDQTEHLDFLLENPLLRSGLILAGAARRGDASARDEDGILTAEEIASLDLRGAEWAVLSACDTGLGEVKAGEGVYGLRRAFQVAGARTVIMSLWPVDDAASLSWMRALYKARFRDGLDTARAVRAACRAVMRERRDAGEGTHPFFWGAWIASTG